MTHKQPPVTVIRSAKRKKTAAIEARGDGYVVRIPARMSAREEEKMVASLVRRIEAKRARGQLHDDDALRRRAEELNAQYLESRARISSIRWVRNQHRRWGSTSVAEGSIRLSHRLKPLPSYVVDAVIVHEMVHTFVPGGHGPEFRAWVMRYPHTEKAEGFLEALSFMEQRAPS
ncbi:SprT-like domain-containing protein [Corynebacterium ciconiae]|uniref:SprT-like domain-containing protein n=1 Tax=Corynebacterium ciconiae TaxID=227319 RepID=UPI0005907F5C|nr:SprT-like domain-containing protein [Corynebacterium ciconiae]